MSRVHQTSHRTRFGLSTRCRRQLHDRQRSMPTLRSNQIAFANGVTSQTFLRNLKLVALLSASVVVLAPINPSWAASAVVTDKTSLNVYWSYNYPSAEDAKGEAFAHCLQNGGEDCEVTNSCGAGGFGAVYSRTVPADWSPTKRAEEALKRAAEAQKRAVEDRLRKAAGKKPKKRKKSRRHSNEQVRLFGTSCGASNEFEARDLARKQCELEVAQYLGVVPGTAGNLPWQAIQNLLLRHCPSGGDCRCGDQRAIWNDTAASN